MHRSTAFHHEAPCPSGCPDGGYEVSGMIDPPERNVGFRGAVQFDSLAVAIGEHENGCPEKRLVSDFDTERLGEDVWEKAWTG